jgi:hydroxymethylglutaryl-CoA reductase (NADPH)
MKVALEAGGVDVRVLREGLVVWPTLAFDRVADALAGARWIAEHQGELVAAANATTGHGAVTSLTTELLGRRLQLRLEMTTGDAHGINMVTRAAGAVCARIPGATQVLLHGYDVEKRASAERGRGRSVVAELVVPAELVARHWKGSAARIAELWQTYALAFGRMGTATHAIQVANGLGAIYLATGQDIAYLAESAACTLSIEDRSGDLHTTLDVPNLHAATVGGGTQKGTAAECQALIGASSATALACVIAGSLLVGDVNLAASFLGDDFVGAHERLGRNRPA